MCITDVQEVMNCESSILTSFGASCTVPLNSSESPRISDYIPCSCLEVGPSGYKFKVSEMVFISTRNTIICFTKYIKIPVMIYQVKITLKDLFRRQKKTIKKGLNFFSPMENLSLNKNTVLWDNFVWEFYFEKWQ